MTVSDAPKAPAKPRDMVQVVLLLFLVGVVLPLCVASYYGALGIPRSDDWSYLVSLFRWVDSGTLAFNDWVSMTLVGQLIITVPLVAVVGQSIWAVQIFAALIGFIGLLGVVWLGRIVIPMGRGALLLAVTIALGPLWAPLAATYMTDVPAFAAQMIALALAASALRRTPLSIPLFAAAMFVGFIGISIRQYGVIPVIAIVVIAVWSCARTGDRARLRTVLALSAATALCTLALLFWWSGLPDSLSLAPEPPASGAIAMLFIQGAGFLRLTGLLLLPVILLANPIAIFRRAWSASAATSGVVVGLVSGWLLVAYVRVPAVPFVGNYIDRHGVLADDVLIGHRVLNGERPPVIPTYLFDLLALIGSVGGLLLALAAVPYVVRLASRLQSRESVEIDAQGSLLVLTLIGFVVAYAVALLTGLPIFDRYALLTIPIAGLLLLRTTAHAAVTESLQHSDAQTRRATARCWTGAIVTLTALGLVGLAFSTDSASFDATRWEVATKATERGYGPLDVYGGFEWLAYHRQRGPRLSKNQVERQHFRSQDFQNLCVDLVVNPIQRIAVRGIARGEVRGLAHKPVLIVAVPNDQTCLSDLTRD
ncbi:MAG: hypothetical protein EXQ69_08290 [Acidimicrobiia bacterium]|nr:hypothetical protein [Acidimicrobiia bacterium]